MNMMMELPSGYPESPMEQDDVAYPCKGCGEILEEGKAFELAGNRWHIDCFRCNTCSTLLDSDANLLLLGDGSLICNNCTYSCSACKNKIEDLAILTGDQAFCASCFRCRNCKKKIENLRYARTSQGIFCMECHEGLMARRRKKTGKHSSSRHKTTTSSNTMLLDKSLPSLPSSVVHSNPYSPGTETPPSDTYSDTPTELPPPSQSRPTAPRTDSARSSKRDRDRSPAGLEEERKENLMLAPTTYNGNRHSTISLRADSAINGDDFFIPMALDPNPAPGPSPLTRSRKHDVREEQTKSAEGKSNPRDYFTAKAQQSSSRRPSQDHESAQLSSRSGSRPGSHGDSGPSSPHIAYQEKGREPTTDILDTIRKRSELGPTAGLDKIRDTPGDLPTTMRPSRNVKTENEQFRLQEVPKSRKAPGNSARNSRSDFPSPPLDTSIGNPKPVSAPASASAQFKEQKISALSDDSPRSLQDTTNGSPQTSQDPKSDENTPKDSPQSRSFSLHTQLQYLPQRGDSLFKSTAKPSAISRKDVTPTATTKLSNSALAEETDHEQTDSAPTTSSSSQDSPIALMHINGGRTISRPLESPITRSSTDLPHPPGRSRDRVPPGASTSDSFVAPRVPPHPPMEIHYQKTRNDSISTLQSESTRNGEQGISPKLPRHSGGGELSMEEDMARILGHDEQDHASFLRRVSNSVRHARSYSDRGTRLSKEPKWPKSPLNGSSGFSHDISSPVASSPETRDELMWFRTELRRERQINAGKDQKIAELEAALEGKTSIKQMNSELREKRTTMVVLDTQKEIVVRELDVLTEHIAAAKKSGEPLDLEQLSNVVLREFAESLQKLKDSYTPQIEDLMQTKTETIEELSNLTQLKDKTLQEFEQLSLKNAQLAELNNQLVHQIQELYKANAGPSLDVIKPPIQGLGIYSHHLKERSNAFMDSRDLRTSIAESQLTGSTTVQEHGAEPATILTTPQVVNIRKGQPKKFNWKKGGHNVAKGVTKGLKGVFASEDGNKYQREGSITESMPYNSMPYGTMPQTLEYPSTNMHRNAVNDPRQGFAFFGTNQKTKPVQWKPVQNGSAGTVTAEHASVLFGSELEQRAEFEKVSIPGIVTRCIQEVELRGMDLEGIYRKSGGNSQIQQIREGFERTNDFDISDPDLDIMAVTSTLKQYFRKLPTPLITWSVYDKLLDSTATIDESHRIIIMRNAINQLPARHRDCLEFLVFHLARVVERERENLMTSLNCAVVFAPTIMRPESLTREMTDTQMKNQSVQFLIENCHSIFLGDS